MSVEYCWFFKLPDDSEHPFYYGPEPLNPLENVSGFKQGSHYFVQAPSLSGASGLNPYAIPIPSGPPLPWWASGNPNNDCYYVLQTDVIQVSGFVAIP